MKKYFLFVFIVFAFACNKNFNIGESVDIYEIEDYNTMDDQIIERSVKLSDNILISYEDIVSYNSKTHSFLLTDEKASVFENEEFTYFTKAFALTVDKEIIYTGYFWTLVSSRSCDRTTILYWGNNKLSVNLGYPGSDSREDIPDKRNDKRILEVFKSDKKLKD